MRSSTAKVFKPQWEIDERTIRDCPGGRTEVEWRAAVEALARRLQGGDRACPTCDQPLATNHKYAIHETEEWLPGREHDLPRGRWAVRAFAATLAAARKLQRFMGPRATIWIRTARRDNASSYKLAVGPRG